MIEIRSISKTYKVPIRNAGIFSALKSFFKREFKHVEALKAIDFSINKGEIVGYIGPNGAGKSTTIKIMSGILRPDSGTCIVNGRNPFTQRQAHSKEIGVVFGQRTQLWWDIPVIDSFELLRDMYSIEQGQYERRLAELINLLDLNDLIRIPTRQLSLGQRMRCEICASLLHNPKVLFLDEPTIGLDAISKASVRNIIRDINQRFETTIVLTTHDMQDIEALASRIILIGRGEILFDGTFHEFKKKFSLKRYLQIDYLGNFPISDDYKVSNHGPDSVTIEFEGNLSKVIAKLSQSIEILDVSINEESIDDMMVHVYDELSL